MRRKLLYTLMFSSFLIVGCAGGGGGGGGANNPGGNAPPTQGSGPSTPVAPVVAPTVTSNITQVGVINPLVAGPVAAFAAIDAFTADLTNSGQQNVVTAGWHSNGVGINSSNHRSNVMNVFGWSNGQLVDQTSQWFAPGDNIIKGTSSLKFGNFNGSAYSSMFVTPFTDGITDVTQMQIFTNDGRTFTRHNIDLGYSMNSGDSTLFKYNGMDAIVSVDYNNNTTFILPSRTNNFKAIAARNIDTTGSSIAAGDFLGNGSTTFVITDNGLNAVDRSTTKLFSWNYNSSNDSISMSNVSTLPTPIFNQSAYYSLTGGNNSNKVVTFDFDGSGVPSVFIISMSLRGTPQYQSSIQFLKNNGTGTFTDVTSSTVTGYDMSKPATNNPIIIDLLNTGLPSIVLPTVSGTQVLTQVSKGKYVASMGTVIDNFSASADQLSGTSKMGTVTFVRGPNNNLYLLDIVPMSDGTTTSKKGVYLTQLTGSTLSTSAKTAIAVAKNMWPYLTDQNLSSIISATGMSYNGATILDVDALLSPSGQLSLPVGGRNIPINGWVSGLSYDGGDMTALDSLGRAWRVNLNGMQRNTGTAFDINTEHIDQYNLTSHAEYLVNGSVNTYNGMRMGSEGRNAGNTFSGNGQDLGPSLLQKPTQYTFGVPEAYRKGNFSYGMQYTSLNSNPWISFGGAWGSVTSSNILDNVVTYRNNGFSAQASLMHVTTNITPGLITNVNNMVGTWAETGYRFGDVKREGDVGIYLGVKPLVLSGNIDAKVPTGIDNSGNTIYTNKKMMVQNQLNGYARGLYTTMLDRQTQYRFSAMATQQGQYRLMHEIKFWLD